MKKLIVSTILAGFAFGAFAQGTVVIQNSGAANITTNNGVGNILGAGNYIFAVLSEGIYQGGALPAGGTNNVLNGTYQFVGAYATNTATAGRIIGGGGAAGEPTSVVAWPVYQTNVYVIVGWSANEGTSWATVSNELATGSWVANGFFGISAVGDQAAGGIDPITSNPVNPATLIGAAANGVGGINEVGGFSLLSVGPSVAVPEPSTMALAGLGGLSMLLFRRKK
jgi:hypothetical protein